MTTATLSTNLTSAGVKSQIQDLMSRLSSPGLTTQQYVQIRYEFFKLNEASYNQIYDDQSGAVLTNPANAIGKVTVGIGFNMDRAEARTEWNQAFQNSVSFDDVYNNRTQLTNDQVKQLFNYSATVRENRLFGDNGIYGSVADQLSVNQKLAIEDLFFNSEVLAKRGTNFFDNITNYATSGKTSYLDNALNDVLQESNKYNVIGLSNRRLKEAALLAGDADIKIPDSEIRQLINANQNKFEIKIDGKSVKEYYDNQVKNNGLSIDTSLYFDDSKFYAYDPDIKYMLADSGMITSDALSPLEEAILRLKDDQGKEFSLVKDVLIPLKDGTVAAARSVIEAIDSAKTTLVNFIQNQASGFVSDYKNYLADNKDLIIGDLITRLIRGESLEEAIVAVAEVWGVNALLSNDMMNGNFNHMFGIDNFAKGNGFDNGYFEYVRDAQGKILKDSHDKPLLKLTAETEGQITNAEILAGAKSGAVFFISTILISQIRGEGLGTTEYTEAAIKSAAIGAMSIYFPGVPVGAVVAIMDGAIEAITNREDLDSQGWQDLSTNTAAGVSAAVVGWYIGMQIGSAIGSVFPGIGTIVGAVVGALIGAIMYIPLKNLYSNTANAVEDIYDAIEDTVIKLDFSSDNIEESAREAVKAIEDLARAYSIEITEDVLIGVYNLFGHYGKTYKAGEYPTPYSLINITPKEDGTGNIIQGVNPQGVVAIAREYYHDDIYGTNGSDNLVGKSGTNTIVGYEGNDHLEGRGDIDLLVGGQGDDEIFGGNGDDQIYGSEGSDNLFGGNGNDTIIGGTGATIGGSGSLEDGNDFIQGGNGDDQIMAEAGDDVIQGNAGNDTILGGTGNDRIEGNEGDDSILGEDGNDMVLAGDGNDVIDGGAGVDIVYAGSGNDNIRGGDGDDEIYGESGIDIIYGDAGNDLINTGSENDLAFGGLGNDIIYGADGDDTLSGELGNDYIIGAVGNDTLDGGAGDDVILGGEGDDTITTGEGNDTIIYRIGDGQDTIIDTDNSGSDTLRLSEINSKLSNGTTNKLVLTKSGTDLVIQFKDDSGAIITGDQITVTNQFGGSGTNGTGSEILKTIEFADSKAIDLTNLTIDSDGIISYSTSTYTNIDTTIQGELVLGYNDQMQVIEEQENPDSTYSANNYNSSGEQDEIDSELYNDVQWRSMKKKRSIFGGHYTVWYKYYEGNLSGTNGNDRVVGSWWSENVYGGTGDDQLHGGDGNDNLFGGEGADILHGGAGADNLYGQNGEDLIYGGSGNDNISGGADNDTIYANDGNDTINGDAGDDYIEGNAGNDSFTDNEGNNVIIAGGGTDIITTGSGNDKIEGNDDADTINAGDGNNLIYGNGGNDIIISGSGNDTINGQEGFDLINAGAGDDYISGGANDDVINGQDGADTIYGDTGIDQISGGAGNDFIYGGSGADVLSGDAGDDQIKGGDSDDLINGGDDNDSLYGQSGSDTIYGDGGNDYIDGGINGDVLDGGDGNDTIIGGQGNDILVDGAGSDILDGGADSDIIILTKENDTSSSIDTIKNFNKDEDKIILKVSYQTPITFADIQSNIIQNGANAEIALDNGQKIIIENTSVSDITNANFQIGLSGGENNDILFGTNGEDIIFGDAGDDQIYGGEGNDELWGGKGYDELYGEGGDDILRYEADGKYGTLTSDFKVEYDANVTVIYGGFTHNYPHYAHYFTDTVVISAATAGISSVAYDQNNDIVVDRKERTKELIYSGSMTREYGEIDDDNDIYGYWVVENSRFKSNGYILSDGIFRYYPGSTTPWNVWLVAETPPSMQEYKNNVSNKYSAKNFLTGQLTDITGFNSTFDKFIGGDGVNTILMTEGNDVLALDDPTSAAGNSVAGSSSTSRVQNISVIHAGAGDDVINFSTQKYSYSDTVVYGGTGNDKIWMSSGADKIFGQEGNDEIYSGAGNDELNGGSGNDVLYAGIGNDTLEGGSGVNQLYGEDGDDTFIAGSGTDTISGGNGNDTVSYINSTAAININLATNTISGGDAANDTISSIENVTGSAFSDILVGNSSANIFNGGSGDDSLVGGTGSDTYIYDFNSGTDTIQETGNSGQGTDSVQFSAGISAADLAFTTNGNDLEIQVGTSSSNKLILKDQLLDTNRIEFLKFASSINNVAISTKFFIANEDVALTFTNPLSADRNRFESLTALYGSLVFDEAINQFTYQSNTNFHGIDEITINEEDGTENKYTIFVNGVNDAPIFTNLGDVPNKEVKVEEEWSVNLRDYFTDVDGDNLSLSLKLQGFENLPDWVNFNSTTGIVSGRIGRDGKLNFTVTASDLSGATLSDNFRISITRSIADDIRPTTPIVQIIGTDGSDIITATSESSDIISGGAGDDIINYTKDNEWEESSDGSYYTAWNVYSGDEIAVTGKQRSFDAFDGGDGYDVLNLTDQNDVIFLDDAIVSNIGDIAKLSSIEEINSGVGDDVVDLTSLTFTYEDVIINGGAGDDILWGNDGNDTINGDEGDDNIQGGKGDDILNGGIGDDTIKGYDDDDQINGGAGVDVLLGGDGNDTFIFTNISDSSNTSIDLILDFIQNEDKIDLSALDFDSITQGKNSNLSANGLEFYFENGNTIIDDPNSNFAVKLAGEIQLGASDFNF